MIDVCIELSQDFENLIIVPISDVHLGDPQSRLDILQEHVDFIRNTPNAYTVLLGDLINNGTKNSKSDVYKDTMCPNDQLLTIVNILQPIAHKILVMVEGNHEARTGKESGTSITSFMAYMLGISNRYSDGQALIFLDFGKNKRQYRNGVQRRTPYTIFCSHGTGGGGSTPGGKLKALSVLPTIIDADIYISGHTHQVAGLPAQHYRVDKVNKQSKEIDSLLVNVNAYLDYSGSYGEKLNLKPTAIRVPYIHLSGDKVKYHVEIHGGEVERSTKNKSKKRDVIKL